MPFINSGRVRLIGITTAERSKVIPDVPTMAEQSAPGLDYQQWIGMGVTGTAPSALIGRINAELVRAAKSPYILSRLEGDGMLIIASTPETLRQRVISDNARWRKVAQDTGAKLAQ